MKLLVYHNGECSKCQALTELLHNIGADIEYKFYLHEPLSVEELEGLLQKLQLPATAIIRTSEPLYAEQFEGKQLTDTEWLQAIVNNRVLLQRPIVVYGDKAIIARPPEKLLEIL